MSNVLGEHCRLTIFGQSHAPTIGGVIEGLPAGIAPDMAFIAAFMARRAPGGALSTSRREADAVEIIAGLNEWGRTCGAPLAFLIRNGDQHSRDYASLRDVPRPGHADYTAAVKFGGENDIRGGGQFSGRLTAPLCFAGALALQLLKARGIVVKARVHSVAGIQDAPMDLAKPDLDAIIEGRLPCVDSSAAERMAEAIESARADGDSVGGVVECFAVGVPAGLGDPMFDGVENRLARALFGIPAVRGVEFGLGFGAANMAGSEHNDAYYMEETRVATKTNRHGGALGGITSGMPIVVRAAFKPTPSIAKPQKSVSLSRKMDTDLAIHGRHDPCVVPRAVPVVEAAVGFVILDMMLENGQLTIEN